MPLTLTVSALHQMGEEAFGDFLDLHQEIHQRIFDMLLNLSPPLS